MHFPEANSIVQDGEDSVDSRQLDSLLRCLHGSPEDLDVGDRYSSRETSLGQKSQRSSKSDVELLSRNVDPCKGVIACWDGLSSQVLIV